VAREAERRVEQQPVAAVRDERFQDELLAALERLTGTPLPA